MRKSLIIFAIAIVFVAMTSASFAQKNLKIGYVNSEKILKDLPEVIAAEKEMQTLMAVYQDTVKMKQMELQTKLETYKKQQAMMNDTQKKQEEEALQAMDMQIKQYYEMTLGNSGLLARKRLELLEPIINRVNTAIEAVAKAEKCDFVFNRTTQIDILVWADSKYDLTYKVMEWLSNNK